MKKMIFSGQVSLGECGIDTGLYADKGEKLYTGDLVALHHYNENSFSFDGFYGLEFAVSCSDQDSDNGYFVMGVKSEHHAFFDGEPCESIDQADYVLSTITQNRKEWRLTKVKGFSDLVDGEKNGSCRCVFVED